MPSPIIWGGTPGPWYASDNGFSVQIETKDSETIVCEEVDSAIDALALCEVPAMVKLLKTLHHQLDYMGVPEDHADMAELNRILAAIASVPTTPAQLNALKPFTVIMFEDGDYSVETYVECVMAPDAQAAWDVAVKQANAGDKVTEIGTYDGHLAASCDYPKAPRT